MSRHSRKPCKDCGEVLTLRHFYPHPSYRDGRMNTCKLCHIRKVGENRELKEEQYRAMKREISARPKYRQQRSVYATSERGRQVHRAACRRYYRLRRLFEERA
jgi:hypothetical protein